MRGIRDGKIMSERIKVIGGSKNGSWIIHKRLG
jgi:hypothetical protein